MKANLFSKSNKAYTIVQFIIIAAIILIFTVLLVKSPLSFLRALSLSMRVDLWPVIPITAILLYFIFRIPGKVGEVIALPIVIILFLMPLAGMWAYGFTQSSIVGGLIQLNDARGYYTDALRLSIGDNFSFFSSRRPLFPGFLSLLLTITQYNLMATLVILSIITAISCYYTAREVQRTHGTETATFLLMMMFLYYRLHSGISMSENFGIAMGCLAFIILWRGAKDKNIFLIGFGVFSTTIALNIRAGAFFILPLLVLWAGRLFRESKYFSWKAMAVTSISIILGFSCSLLLGHFIGQPNGIPFANFSYTLYSLAAGGKSWAYIMEVHPEILLLPEPELSKKVFQLAFELMKEKPLQSIEGAIFFWKAIFTDTLYNVFSFVAKENWEINPYVKWTLYLLSTFGILSWFGNKKSTLHTLTLVCILGIFLSVPFVPPTDSFRMRPYASSIAMLSILPALGLNYIINKIKSISTPVQLLVQDSPFNTPIYLNILLILGMLLGPLAIKYVSSEPALSPYPCNLDTEKIIVRFSNGTYINLLKNTDEFQDWIPNIHTYLFQKNAHAVEDVNFSEWLETIKPSTSMILALDILDKRDVLIVMPTDLLPKNTGYVQFCGSFEQDPLLLGYSIFNVNEVIKIIHE